MLASKFADFKAALTDSALTQLVLISDGKSDRVKAMAAARRCLEQHLALSMLLIDPTEEGKAFARDVVRGVGGTYQPEPGRGVRIPKPGGGQRSALLAGGSYNPIRCSSNGSLDDRRGGRRLTQSPCASVGGSQAGGGVANSFGAMRARARVGASSFSVPVRLRLRDDYSVS